MRSRTSEPPEWPRQGPSDDVAPAGLSLWIGEDTTYATLHGRIEKGRSLKCMCVWTSYSKEIDYIPWGSRTWLGVYGHPVMAELLCRITICCVVLSVSAEVINLGVILPFNGTHEWTYPKTGPGIMYAVETIDRRPDILAGHTLRVNYGDSKCSDLDGPLVAIDMYIKKEVDVFIGPACEYAMAPVARYSPRWNIPIITGGAFVHAFSDREPYSLLTRIGGSYAKLAEFVLTLFRQFRWLGKTGLIYYDNIGDNKAKGRTDCYFIMESMFILLDKSGKQTWHDRFDVPANASKANFTSMLKEASRRVRSKLSFSPVYQIQLYASSIRMQNVLSVRSNMTSVHTRHLLVSQSKYSPGTSMNGWCSLMDFDLYTCMLTWALCLHGWCSSSIRTMLWWGNAANVC